MSEPEAVPPGVDPTRPSAGRLYDYYLGGTEHLQIDRIAAERISARMPEPEDGAWANRGFPQRSARWMAAEAGIRQFVDIGAGLPTRNNTHGAVGRAGRAHRLRRQRPHGAGTCEVPAGRR